MKKFLKIFLYYALIPNIASVLALFCLALVAKLAYYLIPAIVILIYFFFRKKIDIKYALIINKYTSMILAIVLTIMTLILSGDVDTTIMSYYYWLIIPFAPFILISMFIHQNISLFITAILTYLLSYIYIAFLSKIKVKKFIIPTCVVIVCLIITIISYNNRPSIRYAGHGFDYMNGFSSTDFTDYTVYADNSKLAILDHKPSLVIENEEEMPILDGAEACYPLYSAFAKAVYKDIDVIEKKGLNEVSKYNNGKIVSFTNTKMGFYRLLHHEIDMFFGAMPSKNQIETAEDENVELEITTIGYEAFVFFVERDNPIEDITTEQLKAIYHGDITNWKQLGGKNQEILAFQRPKDSGSQTIMEYFMGDISLQEPKTYETISPMAGVIKNVAQYANEKGAIGYSFRYFLEELNQEEDVKMLSIDGVYPSLKNIENGTYPIITDVCLIYRKDEQNENIEKMKEFILSSEGQEIVHKTGYASLKEK